MRVLHVIDTGGPGGAETVFLHTSSRLSLPSKSIVSRDGWLANAMRQQGVEPMILSAQGSLNVSYLRELLRVVTAERIDLIAAHLYGSAVYCSLAGIIARKPVVCVLHGQSDITGKGRLSWLKRFIVRHGTDRAVFVSKKLEQEIASALRIPAHKCRVIPNGIDLQNYSVQKDDSLRKELGLPEDAIVVGAVGNIRRPKAYDVFLKAAQLLRSASSRFHFVIAGEGSGELYAELQGLRDSLGLRDAVTFLGLRSDVPRVLRNLDAYALSSTTEGFSIACVEAMASGIPVVATRSGGPEEILQHERSGLLVPTNDPAALASSIQRVCSDEALRQSLTAEALRIVKERYSIQAMLEAYEALFNSLVRDR